MQTESDSLSRLFAEAREPLAPDPFLSGVLLSMMRARRARVLRRVVLAAAIVIIAAFNLPAILNGTAAVLRYTDWMITPWGWAVSMVVGAWVILRTRPSRR